MADLPLNDAEIELLEAIDLAPMGWTPHAELQKLIRLGLAQAELLPWGPCFYAVVSATRQGVAKVRRLH